MTIRGGGLDLSTRSLHEDCWLAMNGVMDRGDRMPSCEGRLIRAHLIPQRWLNEVGGEAGDPRSYVLACGGITGVGGHHGMFDYSRTLRVPVEAIPADTLEMAAELRLEGRLLNYYERRS